MSKIGRVDNVQGWVKLHRSIYEKPIFQNEKLLKVWVWCLFKATHKELPQMVGRKIITLAPGEFITGRNKMADELEMKPSTAWEYLKLLELNESIKITSKSKFSIITLVNWEGYQKGGSEDLRAKKDLGSDSKPDSKSDSKPDSKKSSETVEDKELQEPGAKISDSKPDTCSDSKPDNKSTTNRHKQECKELKEVRSKKKEKIKRGSNSSPKKEYGEDHKYYQIALYLRGKIKTVNENIKVPKDNPKNMHKWSDDVRKILELDKRSIEDLKKVVSFVFKSDFWDTVIQSPGGLRDNWDKIVASMIRESRKKNNVVSFTKQKDAVKEWAENE